VRITLSSDDIPHSFTIDKYRIAKRVEPGRPVVFEFRADQAGRFPIYCNLSLDEKCREMRGCDCRKISVKSETVSSASVNSAKMRSRVSSPAAFNATLSASKPSPPLLFIAQPLHFLHIKIYLYFEIKDLKSSF